MIESRPNRRKAAWMTAGCAVFLIVLATPPARGQCPLLDNLDGGACWTTATPALPVFPVIQTDVRNLCWLNCELENDLTANLEIGQPRQARDPNRAPAPIASVYVSRYTVTDGAGTALWSGIMRMIYSRTWYESSDSANYQVWRFLVNGDLRATADSGPTPCLVPVCAASFNNKVHFTGYVDYARDCATGTFYCSGAVTHELDKFDHTSFTGSPRSGSFHSERNYDFVWPAAGFVPETAENFSSSGFATGNLRPLDWSVLPGSSQIEVFEDRFTGGSTLHFADRICASDPSKPPSTYRIALSATTDACGIQAYSVGGVTSLWCRALGGWTDPARFPGQESVLMVHGFLRMNDPWRPRTRDEHFRGGFTRWGFVPRSISRTGIGDGIWSDMLDLGNELRLPPNMDNSRNVKFISDLVINANILM